MQIKMENNAPSEIISYIAQSNKRLKKILKRLKWSKEATLKNFQRHTKDAKPHNESCKATCFSTTNTFPDSCIIQNSIVLDTPKIQEILQNPTAQAPHNFNELQRNFSREEKLEIYNYVIQNTKKLPSNQELPGVKGELSIADILAQKKREDKRKKRKFRKTKPTHIEEVRCLVELQMQALQQYMGNKLQAHTCSNPQGHYDYNNATNNTYNKDFYKKRNSYQTNERIAEQTVKYTEDIKGCYRVRNRYYERDEHKRRHERSHSREHKRRRSRSRDRHRDDRRRKRSHSRDKRSRERSKRSSRSRSRSNGYTYSRRHSRSPESSKSKNYKQYYDNKYNNNDEKYNKHKFSKHKSKNKREYS